MPTRPTPHETFLLIQLHRKNAGLATWTAKPMP